MQMYSINFTCKLENTALDIQFYLIELVQKLRARLHMRCVCVIDHHTKRSKQFTTALCTQSVQW